MTLPFDHTHDLEVEISRSEYEIALCQEWDGRLTWNEKDMSHPLMTTILTSVTWWGGRMYRWVTGVTSDVGVPSTYLDILDFRVSYKSIFCSYSVHIVCLYMLYIGFFICADLWNKWRRIWREASWSYLVRLGDTDFVADNHLVITIDCSKGPGGRLNKKDGLTRYGDSHVKDKTS